MAAIVTSIEVNRSAEDVFAYAIDPIHFPDWQQGVVDGRLDPPGTPTVGTRCLTTRRIGGANRSSTSEIRDFNPPKSWAVRGVDGPIRASVDLTVEPLAADRSRLTITVDFAGHGIGKLLVPLVVRREARKEMPINLAKLKKRLEGNRP
jgi:Polyketide cyclase / dehydrase and lipid transport